MTQVVLIRPGATVYDEQNRVQGVLDVPLSDRGRAEVARLAASLPGTVEGVSITAVYSGPGESVVRTAEAVGKALGLRSRRVDELRNLDQGLWQGLQIEEIRRRNTRVFRQWLDDPMTVCPPMGEPVSDALERIKGALKPLVRRHQDEAIALVVGEPLARLVACYLKREPRVQFDDDPDTGRFERIVVSAEVGRNGQ